jgi:hypothetical protein
MTRGLSEASLDDNVAALEWFGETYIAPLRGS